jgi:phosphatidate cytidylyltransferase
MLIPRILTAIVLLGVLLPALFMAPIWTWGAITLILFTGAAAEWSRLVGASALWALLTFFAGLAWVVVTEWLPTLSLLPWAVAPALVATVFWLTISPWRLTGGFSQDRLALVGVVLAFSAWQSAFELRRLGIGQLLSIACIVWVADVAAYFGGRAFGRFKLAPTISPGKTWEGVLFAAVAVLGIGCATVVYAERLITEDQGANLSMVQAWVVQSLPAQVAQRFGLPGLLGILSGLTALSITGDLYESLLKREAGVKDSGRSLPGHGGFLDRMDALMPVLPVGFLVVRYLSEPLP